MTLAQAVEMLPWRLLLYVLCAVGAVLAIVRRQRNTLEQQAEYSRRLEQEVAKRTDELRAQNRELAALNHKLQEVSVTDSLTSGFQIVVPDTIGGCRLVVVLSTYSLCTRVVRVEPRASRVERRVRVPSLE